MDFEGGINLDTGKITWRLTAIDPDTGDLIPDLLDGFLPPNINPPEGEGFVTFSVYPRDSPLQGTRIANQATIVFDVNEPISTAEIVNIIDDTGPASSVDALPAQTSSAEFTVSWSGTDNENGSGIAYYTVYVQDDGSAFVPWLSMTPDTSATFTGVDGHTYGFYSIATDNVGNVEEAPSEPDTVTTVQTNESLSVELFPGFNLVAAPTDTASIPDAYSLLSLIGSEDVDKVVKYDRLQDIVREAYFTQEGVIAGDNFPLTPGEALIIYAKRNMIIAIPGDGCPAFSLTTGINWVATLCEPVYANAFDLLQAIGDEAIVSSIQRFNPDTGMFETAGYYNNQPAGVNFPIRAGEGYIIYMKIDSFIVF